LFILVDLSHSAPHAVIAACKSALSTFMSKMRANVKTLQNQGKLRPDCVVL